ncbi:SAM-dependent methyltransferase [Frankia sp. AgB1.8]|nr:SAM-dependent methyltransferase [Frankia sp. AgB1.8]
MSTEIPHIARVYDYWLGGKNNFAADRALAERVLAADPAVRLSVRANRAFLRRAVTFLAGEAGIRQFLDIGTGLPSSDNTHEVAQRVAPESRVVYVDNDPIVLVHARALLTASVAGTTAYLQADAREPEKIIEAAAATLDLSQPVAIMLIAILHSISDGDKPGQLVRALVDAVPSGSYVALTHITLDLRSEHEGVAEQLDNSPIKVFWRTRAEVTGFLDGLEILEPGVVSTSQWRPEPGADTTPMPLWSAIARKP